MITTLRREKYKYWGRYTGKQLMALVKQLGLAAASKHYTEMQEEAVIATYCLSFLFIK